MPVSELRRQFTVNRKQAAQRLDECMTGIERGTAVLARMQVAITGREPEVKVKESATSHRKRRCVAVKHRAVVDETCICAMCVARDPLTDCGPLDLLLAVTRKSHVDRERPFNRQPAYRFQEHEQLALVIRCSPPVDPTVANVDGKRIGLPELERVHRLDIEMAVEQHRWGGPGGTRRLHVPTTKVHRPTSQSLLASARRILSHDPLSRGANGVHTLRIRAHARDGNELGQLSQPSRIPRLRYRSCPRLLSP